ncbi:HIT domain-containing protein [bacterium]|nr:HIT domain-containing protein [bacterium]
MRTQSMDHCLFCKIIENRIPSRRVYQDDVCIAFLDINPVNRGHVLIVPRLHHEDLTSLPPEVAAHVASKLPALCAAVVRATGAEGFNVIVNNGKVAGQTIFHGHWHIIPRFHDDTVNWPWPQGAYFGDEIQQIGFAIEKELAALQNPESGA